MPVLALPVPILPVTMRPLNQYMWRDHVSGRLHVRPYDHPQINLWDLDRAYLQQRWRDTCNKRIEIGSCWVFEGKFGRGIQICLSGKGKHIKSTTAELGLFIEKGITKRSVALDTGVEIDTLRTSRRCQTPCCFNPEHYAIEPDTRNRMRAACHKYGVCSCVAKSGGQPCIIVQ